MDILSELRGLSLVQAFAEEIDEFRHFSIHPLVKDWIRLRTDKKLCQEFSLLATKIVAKLIAPLWRNEQFEMPLSTKQEVLSHLDVHEENYTDFLAADSVMALGHSFLIDLSDAESWFESLYFSSGRYKEAEKINWRVIELRKTLLGPENSSTLTSMNNLAGVLFDQGKYEEAEEMHRRVIRLQEIVLGPEHHGTLTSMNNLAIVLNNQGRGKEAEEIYQRVIRLREKVLGSEHPSTLTSMNNLASVLCNQGKHKEAEEIYQRVIRFREIVLGPEHPDTLTSIYSLAQLLYSRHEYDNAAVLYEKAILGYKKGLRIDHPTTLACSEHYSSMLEEMERIKQQVSGVQENLSDITVETP